MQVCIVIVYCWAFEFSVERREDWWVECGHLRVLGSNFWVGYSKREKSDSGKYNSLFCFNGGVCVKPTHFNGHVYMIIILFVFIRK